MISIASFKKVGLGALFGVFALATAASAAFVSPQNVKVDYTSIAPQSIRVTWQSGGGTGSNFLVRKSRDGQIYQSTAFVGSNVSSYTFNDLSANTQYWFHVSSGDDVGVESPVVTVGPVYSGTFAPRAPTITNLTNNSLRISITPADGNPPSTTYFVREIEATGGLYVQANGTLGSNYYVDTAAGWGSKLISGLNADTKYVFVAVSKNSEGINSNGSPHAQATTAGALMTPNPPQVTDYGTTTVVMRLVPDANTGSVQYGIQDSATGAWLQPNGSMGTASFLNWLNDWGTITIHGLKPNTLYNYRTIVQDTGTGMTKQSPATAIYTAADVPTNVKVAS
ncbi:fibronectin type III domain-containing protein, partial [Candidatus Uhrbacteria bacterium]|nr:fibronectin type III domain-containing protein [Candidatus Uhrbacteria bacterium]